LRFTAAAICLGSTATCARPSAFRPETASSWTSSSTLRSRTVQPPAELREAFAKDPELRAFFDSLSFTHRNEYVRWIEEAKREETRRARAARALAMLRDGVKTPG
jgi:uncharacterized protein YdeI (YjbR/CyaY-like superfamily)